MLQCSGQNHGSSGSQLIVSEATGSEVLSDMNTLEVRIYIPQVAFISSSKFLSKKYLHKINFGQTKLNENNFTSRGGH